MRRGHLELESLDGESLHELVTQAQGDQAAIEAHLDCEVSIGRLGGTESAWRIERSTLPWREGERLFARGDADFDPNSELFRLDTPHGRADWRVLDSGLRRDSVREIFKA